LVSYARGLEQNRSMDAIRAEQVSTTERGYLDVVLLGQDIDAYGRDMYSKRTFGELLRFLHDVAGIERIRFTTSHPRYRSTS
jgi:tRNA-2-methylthio-N6-dimethylallyladenosine synthase